MGGEAVAAWLLIVGGVLFLGGAFLPVARIYTLRSPEEKQGLIERSPRMWAMHLAGMGGGAAVTAVGLAVLVPSFDAPASAQILAYVAAAAALVGTVAWEWHLYLRVIDLRGFIFGTWPGWHFLLYSVLMHVALLALGVALWQSDYPAWAGAVTIGGIVLTGLAGAIFRDVPPLVYYVLTLIVAIVLVI